MSPLGPSYEGSVVLELGGAIGAFVLHTGVDLDGVEIDIDGRTEGTLSTHSVVRARRLPGAVHYAAVYPDLPAGDYEIAGQQVTITGGRVSELHITELHITEVPHDARHHHHHEVAT